MTDDDTKYPASWFTRSIVEMEIAIYAAAFVKVLDEAKMKAGPAEREALWLRAHDFAMAAMEAFRGARQLKRQPSPAEGPYR